MTRTFSHSDRQAKRLLSYAAPLPIEPRADEFDLSWFFRFVRRRIALILIVGALTFLTALPIILSLPKVYHAESRLLVEGPLTSALLATEAMPGEPFDLSMELERILARDVAVRVVEELGLTQREEFNPVLRPTWPLTRLRRVFSGRQSADGTASRQPAEQMQLVLTNYYNALSVTRYGGTNVVQIGFKSKDPEVAAAVPDKLMEIYLERRKVEARKRLQMVGAWLDMRIAEQKQRLATAQQAVARFGRENGISSPEAQSEAIAAIAVLHSRHAEILRQRAEVASTIAGSQASDDWSLSADMVGSQFVADLQRELRLQLLTLAQLQQTHGEQSKEVADLRSRIAKTKAELGIAIEQFRLAQQAKLDSLAREEAAIDAQTREARTRLAAISSAMVGLQDLRRSAEVEQASLERLEEQRRSLSGHVEQPLANLEVLSPASVPLHPIGRGKVFFGLVAFVAAGSVAFAAGLARELSDTAVRSPEQLRGLHGILPAGLLPCLTRQERLRLERDHRIPGGFFHQGLRATQQAFARLNAGEFPESVVVTSALTRAGKTTIALSIAADLAAEGKSILLVDADLRYGLLSRILRHPTGPGLCEHLNGEADLKSVITYNDEWGFHFIGCGASRLNTGIDIGRMRQVIDVARADDCIVIVDSSPVLAVAEIADLAGLAKRTLLVVRWGRTYRRSIEAAISRLEATCDADILLAINMVRPARHALYDYKDAEFFRRSFQAYHRSFT